MATITKGKTFISGETVEPADLHQLVDQATIAFVSADDTDNSTLEASGGKLRVKDAGVTDAKLATGAVTGAAGGGKLAASAITAQTAIDALADDDTLLIHDDSNTELRKVTWSQMVAAAQPVQPVGSVLQTIVATTSATTAISTTYAAGSKPQYNVNNIVLTQAITPSSESNKLLIRATVSGVNSTSGASTVVALFNTTSGDAIAAELSAPDYGYSGQIVLTFLHSPNTTSEITYRLGVGPISGTFNLNSLYNTADSDLGGLRNSNIVLQEIKG